MSASVFIATSVDGFIARADGAIDWLTGDGETGEDYGYRAFFDTVDALVLGRASFEQVRGFRDWPYGDKPVIVLSRRDVEIPGALADTVQCMSATPLEVVRRLAARGLVNLYVDGGRTIQGFLRDGLVDRLIITRVPVLLGEGIPLFGPLAGDLRLEHVATRSWPGGLVQSEYRVATP